MKKSVLLSTKNRFGILLIAVILSTSHAFGLTYTAGASGNWSSSATWVGGVAPSFNLASDAVVIPSGITVTMDNSVSVTGVIASIDIEGTLTSNSSMTLTIGSLGTLSGAGTLNIGTLGLQTGSIMSSTGTISVGTMNTAIASLQLGAGITVAQMLNLSAGTLSVHTGGSISMSPGSTISISGGLLATSGGTLNLTSTYNVIYSGGSVTTGLELGGTGLNNVTVNVSNGNTVTLASNLTVTGNLSLSSGSLVIGANTLTINGDVTSGGTGNISSSIVSNLIISNSGGIGGTLTFATASSINNLSINVGQSNQVQIGGSVAINGTLTLTSGTLNFGGASLTISGALTGTGSLSSNNTGNLTVNTALGLSGSLSFASGGQVVNNFTVNVGSGYSATLSSGLTVAGVLGLTGGSNLVISGDTLTVGGSLSGTGSLVVDSATALIVNGSTGISAPISISGSLGTFVVNVGDGNSVAIGSNISVSNVISLQSGALVLNSNNLSITGNIAGGGSGTISSSGSSNIVINTALSPAGGLTFTAGGNSLGNLSVYTGGSLNIGSNLNVSGTLALNGGTINIGNDTLNITGSGTITGGGSSTYIIATGSGALGLQLLSNNTSWVIFPVGTAISFAPISVQINAGSSSAGTIYVTANSGILSQGTTGIDLSLTQPVVNVTWLVEPSLTSNINLNLMTMWPAGLQVNGFNPDSAFVSHFINGAWNTSAASSATLSGGMYQLQLSGITSFSPFAVFGSGASTTTAINEIAATKSPFEVCPNPVTDNLTIERVSTPELTYADIMDMNGRIVVHYQLTNLTTNISLSNLSTGNYVLRLYNDNTNEVKRFIKM